MGRRATRLWWAREFSYLLLKELRGVFIFRREHLVTVSEQRQSRITAPRCHCGDAYNWESLAVASTLPTVTPRRPWATSTICATTSFIRLPSVNTTMPRVSSPCQ